MDFARQRQASSSCFLSVRLGEPLRLSEPGRSRTEESESAICGVDGRTRTIGPPSLPSPPPPFFLHLGDCGSVTGRDLGAVPPSMLSSLYPPSPMDQHADLPPDRPRPARPSTAANSLHWLLALSCIQWCVTYIPSPCTKVVKWTDVSKMRQVATQNVCESDSKLALY